MTLSALLYKKQLNTRRNALFWLFVFVPPLVVACVAAFALSPAALLAKIAQFTTLPTPIDLAVTRVPTWGDGFAHPAFAPVAAANVSAFAAFLRDAADTPFAVEFHAENNVTVWFNASMPAVLPGAVRWLQMAAGAPRVQEWSVPFGAADIAFLADLAPAILGAVACALAVGGYGVQLVEERERGLVRQLRLAGASPVMYWGAHFVVDVVAQWIVSLMVITVLAMAGVGKGMMLGGPVVLLVAFAPAGVAMAYSLSFLFGDAQSAQKWFPVSVNALLMFSMPIAVVCVLMAQLYSSAWYVVLYVMSVVLPFVGLLSGFALVVLGPSGAFVGVVVSVLVGGAVWLSVVLLLDARRMRPLKTVSVGKKAKKWLRSGAVEADDVRDERLRVEHDQVDDATLAIKMRRVKRRFNDEVIAVRGITCTVGKGECFGLLGPNGAGKTTTIGILTGTIEPDEGEMWVGGFNVATQRDDMHRVIGVCPQFDCLYERLTGDEHLELFARLKHVSAADRREHLLQVCEPLGLDSDVRSRRVSTLSGGTRRKLSLSLAVLGKPAVVWLDEPTTGMDPMARRATWDVIGRLRSPERTFILTTHNLEEADALCSRIGILADGRLRAIGTTAALKAAHGSGLRVDVTANAQHIAAIDTFLRDTFSSNITPLNDFGTTRHYSVTDIPIATLFKTLEGAKSTLSILDYCVSETTLEQVFLQLVAQAQR